MKYEYIRTFVSKWVSNALYTSQGWNHVKIMLMELQEVIHILVALRIIDRNLLSLQSPSLYSLFCYLLDWHKSGKSKTFFGSIKTLYEKVEIMLTNLAVTKRMLQFTNLLTYESSMIVAIMNKYGVLESVELSIYLRTVALR